METVQIKFTLQDEASGALRKIVVPIDEVRNAMREASKSADEARGLFTKMADSVLKIRAVAAGVQDVASSFAEVTAPAMVFQQRMADLSAITGVMGADLDRVADMARRIGKESGMGAAEAARAFSVLAGQLDAPVDDIGLILEKSAMLAQAADLTIDDAANSLAATISQYGLAADDAERIMNVLAAGSQAGASEVVDLAQSFKVVGAAAASLGVDVEHTAGALEVLGGANIKGAEAGTALRNVLLSLKTKLGIDTSVTDLSDALTALQPRLQDTEFLAKTFGVANVTAATYLIQNADAVREMTDAVTDTQAAQEQADIRGATWAHNLEVTRAKIDDLKISIGMSLGAFGSYGAVLSESIPALTSAVETAGTLSTLFGPMKARLVSLVSWIGKTTFGQRAAAIASRAWAVAQTALNAVMSMNPIGLMVAAISALVAAIGACIYWFDTWGETVLNCMGPLGWAIASVVRHWESLKTAFTDGGIVAGIVRIGEVMMDAILAPLQKALGWVAELTGWDWAKQASEWAHQIRVDHQLTEPDKADQTDTAAKETKEKTSRPSAPAPTSVGLNSALSSGGMAASATAQTSQIKRIDISIDKVVENFTVSTTNLAQSAESVRDMVARALTDAVNDVNYAL